MLSAPDCHPRPCHPARWFAIVSEVSKTVVQVSAPSGFHLGKQFEPRIDLCRLRRLVDCDFVVYAVLRHNRRLLQGLVIWIFVSSRTKSVDSCRPSRSVAEPTKRSSPPPTVERRSRACAPIIGIIARCHRRGLSRPGTTSSVCRCHCLPKQVVMTCTAGQVVVTVPYRRCYHHHPCRRSYRQHRGLDTVIGNRRSGCGRSPSLGTSKRSAKPRLPSHKEPPRDR